MNPDSKIYVAGHNGLVGSAIIHQLQKKGYTNLVTRTHGELDLIDQQAVAKFFDKEKPDLVFLAAARVGGIVANNTYRADFIYQNLMIQNNIIHQSYLNNVEKLLFLGSTCIYPRQAPQPMPEHCLLSGALEYTNEPYAIAKIAGIKLCESYNLQYGTNFISVMPTNLYGPNDNFDLEQSHVLPALIRKLHLGNALENKDWETIRNDLNRLPIDSVDGQATEQQIRTVLSQYGISLSQQTVQVEIWGSGSPRREFLWSEDMADACVFLMENRDFKDTYSPEQDDIRNTHINIGTGIDISIKQLVEIVREKVGFTGELHFNPDKPDGTMIKLTDPSKLHALGWKHTVDLPSGIEKLYQWYTKDGIT